MAVSQRHTVDWSGGQMDTQFLRRADVEQLANGAKRLKNVLLQSGGGFMRRPGSSLLAALSGEDADRVWIFRARDYIEYLVFGDERLRVFSASGTALISLSPMPWSAAQAKELSIVQVKNGQRDQVYLYHPDLAPRVLTRTGSGSWSIAAFSFAAGVNGRTLQPYYRYEEPGVTVTLGARTGTTTATFSQGFLTSDHEGVKFRYALANEFTIDTVNSATSADVTINQTLFPTVNLTVTSGEAATFAVGQVVQGDVSDRQARVTGISGTTLTVLMLDSLALFEVIGSAIEKIVGPTGSAQPSAQSVASSPAATALWDEALVSAARGYPSTGIIHRSRHFFAGLPAVPSLLAASAVGDYDNFDVGEAASTDAIVELLGADPYAQIKHLVSAEQLLIWTDRSVHYVPEGGEAPITPTTISFLEIGPEGCADAPPVLATEGAMFIHADTGRLMVCAPTGNVRRSWQILDLSETAPSLFGTTVALAVANGLDGRPERYVMALQDDGSITVGLYRRGGEQFGYVQWERGRGEWTWLDARGDLVCAISSYGDRFVLSEFKLTALVDDEGSYAAADGGRNGEIAEAVQDFQVIGSGTVASGEVPGVDPASGLTIGIDFDVTAETLPPSLGRRGVKKARIPRYYLDLIDSGTVRVEDRTFDAPFLTDGFAEPGYTRSRVERGSTLGWSNEPTLTISQTAGQGCALEVRALTFEVAY